LSTNYKNILLRFIAALALVQCFFNPLRAQDPHFSQFYSSPLTLNPANTGLFAGDVRVSSNYRNQWRTVSTPFTTATVAADFQVLNKLISEYDIFGVGFMGMLDQSNNRGLKANYIGASAAYSKSLGDNGNTKISVGFQGTLTTKKVDYSRFVFSRQYTPMGFDYTLPTGEPINGFVLNYPDFSTGILYTGMNSNQANWYIGSSYYHFTRPSESLSSQYEMRVQPRLTFHSGYNFPIADLNRIYFSGIYMKSMLAKEIAFGTVYESAIPSSNFESKLFTGVFFRVQDAIIPYVGFTNNKFQVGMSYDLNISSLKTATQSRGGFELSLLMIFSKDPERSKIPRCTNLF
jgi:type IX secretion system PorP/SprF family membrane protein